MANSKFNRLVERVTQPEQPELGDNALLVLEDSGTATWKSWAN